MSFVSVTAEFLLLGGFLIPALPPLALRLECGMASVSGAGAAGSGLAGEPSRAALSPCLAGEAGKRAS